MAPKKKAVESSGLESSLSSVFTTGSPLPRRDALAVEIARAYVLHHGVIRPDVIKDSVVASANEMASQLGWKDHL